ncbi:12270_t:CDS:2 [Ambispora gerdemannii]|uniref:12270_t:CDS:1 n=1 Tax=Ambispora gerdemannii TaxID=144530 RepID=A0A9N8ZLP9_9GLOM|nr:12270_t:CDS:2 [Ambispora gerdemannii]
MQGNPFGYGLPLQKGSPIKLMKYEPGTSTNLGTIKLNQLALNIIEGINEPVAIIAVAGAYRRGKSFFANLLLGRHDGFSLGSQVVGCTNGIDMWDTPFYVNGSRIILLDCEGINDPQQDYDWATKLFVLCLAISSTFIYNINGVIERNDIEKLFLMKDLTKYIQPPENCQFLPQLVLLLRDFELERNNLDFRQYFIDRLAMVNFEAAQGIYEFFSNFQVHPIAHPGIHGESLQNLERVKSDQFNQQFISDIRQTIDTIFRTLNPKYIGASAMSGSAFAKFLADCVARMNKPENNMCLSIPSEYVSVARYVGQRAIKQAIRIYREGMQENLRDPIKWTDFRDAHAECLKRAQKIFFDKILGTASHIKATEEEFSEDIEEAKEEYVKQNSRALEQFNKNIADASWRKHLVRQYDVMNETVLLKALEDFNFDFSWKMVPGPEAVRVLQRYVSTEYQELIMRLGESNHISWETTLRLLEISNNEKELLEAVAPEQETDLQLIFAQIKTKEREKQYQNKLEQLWTCVRQQPNIKQSQIEQVQQENRQVMEEVKEQNQKKEFQLLQFSSLRKKMTKERTEKLWKVLKVVGQVTSIAFTVIGFLN